MFEFLQTVSELSAGEYIYMTLICLLFVALAALAIFGLLNKKRK